MPQLISVLPIALVPVLLHWLPLWRPRSLWFGVTVSPDFTGTSGARETLRRYRVVVWACTLVAAGLAIWGVERSMPWLLSAGPLLQVVGASAAFALAHARVRPHAARVPVARSAGLLSYPEGLPGGVFGALVPFAMLGGTAWYLRANWDRIPDRFPIHWSLTGTPDRWAGRTWQGVYGSLLLGAVLTGVFLLLAQLLLHASPRGRQDAWPARLRRANLRALVVATWGMSLMLSAFALAPVLGSQVLLGHAWILPLALVALLVPLLWQIVQISRQGVGSDGMADDCWKLGQFYYNPNDPALLVAKRFGVGYTFNLANREAWLLIGALLVLAIVATRF